MSISLLVYFQLFFGLIFDCFWECVDDDDDDDDDDEDNNGGDCDVAREILVFRDLQVLQVRQVPVLDQKKK